MEELNKWGELGWELVQTHFLTDAFAFFLKREPLKGAKD